MSVKCKLEQQRLLQDEPFFTRHELDQDFALYSRPAFHSDPVKQIKKGTTVQVNLEYEGPWVIVK